MGDPSIVLQGWMPLVIAVVTACGPAIIGWLVTRKSAGKASAAAESAERSANTVATAVADAAIETSQKLDAIHSAVNGNLTRARRTIARLRRNLLDVGHPELIGNFADDELDASPDKPSELPPAADAL